MNPQHRISEAAAAVSVASASISLATISLVVQIMAGVAATVAAGVSVYYRIKRERQR